jgi:hypothetical protein
MNYLITWQNLSRRKRRLQLLKVRAKYNSIYLVGYNDCKSAGFRITERQGVVRPKEVKFFGNIATENPEITYGVLEINENLWKQWFGDGPFIKGMNTARSTAEILVKEPGIYYGCPICSFKVKDRKLADKHIDEHVNKFISQFEFELEENNDTIVEE